MPAAQEREVSLLDLLVVLTSRGGLVLRVTAVCTVLATIIVFLLPTEYTAKVLLLPPQHSNSIATELASQMGNLGSLAELAAPSLGLKNPNDMYVALLKSRTVEDAMVKDYGLMHEYHKRYLSEARKKFEHYTDVDGSEKDGLIHISVEDRNPQRAAELANGYVAQFRLLSEHLAITEASQRRLFFQQQLEQAKDNLADAEVALKKTEETTGLIQLDAQARALIESAAMLRAQIAAKQVEIQGMSTFATGQNAELMEAQQELASLQSQLAKLGGSEQSPTSLIVPKGKVPEAGLEYVRRLRDVKYYETVFDILARQYEIAKLDEAKEGAIIQVVDPAIPPDRKSFPPRALIIVGSAVVGLFLGILVALAAESWKRFNEDAETRAKIESIRSSIRRKQAGA
ncbi:MAG: Wzz/FepE/Etk N-terminal domain-containing protein [Acidobacteriaceae bacterium]